MGLAGTRHTTSTAVQNAAVQDITGVQQAVIDAFAPGWRHDPYRSYEVLRDAGPFVPGPPGTRSVPRYTECDAILPNPAWSHTEESELLHPNSEVELPGSFLWMEPPDHTRLRGLVSKVLVSVSVRTTAWERPWPGWRRKRRSVRFSSGPPH